MTSPRQRPAPNRTRDGKDRRRGPLLVVLAGVGVVVLAAVIGMSVAGDEQEEEAAERVPATAAVTITGEPLPEFQATGEDAAVGRVAPTIAGTDFGGAPVRVEPGGSPKVVVFLAHWCPHCQREVPRIQQWIDKEGQPEGVTMVSVSTGVSEDRPNFPPNRWLERERWTVPVIRDDSAAKAAAAYGLSGYPYFVFLDAENRVVSRQSGELETDQLEAAISRLRRAG